MSDTIWVAIITALSASIPTIILSIVNNHFQIRLKRFELEQIAKDNAVNNYLEHVSSCLLGAGIGDIKEYQKAVHVLLYYFPDLDIELLNNAICNNKEEGIDKKLERVYPIIKQLSKSRKEL